MAECPEATGAASHALGDRPAAPSGGHVAPAWPGGQPVPVRGLYSSSSDTSWPLNIDGVLFSLTDARGDFTAAQRDRGKGLALHRMPSQGWPTEAGRGAGANRAALRCWQDMGLDSQLRAPTELSCELPTGTSPTEAVGLLAAAGGEGWSCQHAVKCHIL